MSFSATEPDPSWETHLEELRWRLIACLFVLVLATGASLFLAPWLIQRLQEVAPAGTEFLAYKPGEVFFVYLKVALFAGLTLTLPFALYHLLRFLWPALKVSEQKIALLLSIGGTLLFFAGAAFAYVVLLRPLLAFLLGFGVELALIEAKYSIDYYVVLSTSVMLLVGLSFELPIILCALAYLGVLSSAQLIGYWKYLLFGSFVLAALLTPTPDPFNMSILGLALGGLFGLSILLLKLLRK